MNCPTCAHENRPGAKFCEECAAPLPRGCASCGAELRPTAKFCDECAAPTGASPRPTPPPRAAAAEPADTRKVVTIIFGDLVGSTALHERLDAESVRQFMESYYAAMRGAVEAHGGRVTQVMGDGVKAVFGAPRVAEDDAIRAVRAGVAMQDAFRALAEQQRGRVGTTGLRVAVNTGEVVANDETEIIGDPVNVAARLQEQGKDGDVVIGESTHRLVSTLVTLELLGSFALKGRSEAVKAYRFVSLDRPAGAATAPFVGRDEELARLAAVYTTAVEKPAAGLAVLLGSPGLGKSRLIDEFARRHADAATVVRASCDAAGAATFAPLADALRTLLGIESGASAEMLRATIESALPAEDADRARIASGIAALLAGAPPSPEETFFVVRRLLGALAQTKPVVLVIDDLHWAEPLLLDLVEHLIQWGSGTALFVLIGARPELRDLRSSLVTPGGLVADVVTLHGLDAGAAMRLAANVIGAADLPAAIAAKVLATSEGNPLFVGELVRMLVQEGAITREGDRWIAGANLAALEMPPTIHALLAARIERLRPEERTVLERAAVVGRHFSRSAVAALLPQTADLDARLESLRRSELIERDTGWLLGEPVLRFHHVLIRDAAYRRLLKGTRAELHAKLADWIEAQVGDAPEHDEMIGWHLEQAHAFLRELGPLDESGKRLGERAATRLAAAGRRALARDDLAVAADLLGRAIERLDAENPTRADLALDWCEALLAAGDVGPAAAAIAELERFTADSERLRAWHTCFVGQHMVLTAPSALHETTDAVAAAADALTAQGDAAGEAKAHYVHALALSRLGKVGACEAALDRALAAARRAGDRRRANTVLAIAPLAALWGPSPVTRASGRCLDVVRVLRITQGAPAVEAVALSCQGVLEALRGRTEAARRMIASARKMVEELGITQRLLEADANGGLVALLEGDAIAAGQSLRGAYDGLRDLGLGIDAARAAALLARALLAQDRAEEAEALSHESEALAGDDLKAAIAWRGVRAEALAKRGEHAEAIALATRAVEIAGATDALLDHADARIALAAALRAAGRAGDADAEERRARELWQAKGATLLAERARGDAGRAAPASALAAKPIAAPPSARRRVRPNAATAAMDRNNELRDARDWDAYEALFHEDYWQIDHPTGATYGKEAAIASLRRLLREREPHFAQEWLATLGEFLVLSRRRHGAAGTATGSRFDVDAYENEAFALNEVDGSGLHRRSEVFAADRLASAIARLYERHAELLPEGAARERSAATAHAFGTMLLAPADPDRVATALAPDFESIDHRHLSLWSLRGGDAFVDAMRALHQVAADVVIGVVDVLALGPSALLVRRMHAGTERVGGGAYERPFLVIFATDTAGRLVRAEWFDADREAEALARFDALAGDATPAAPLAKPARTRRVHANAATAVTARVDAAIAAGDIAAFAARLSPSLEFVEHPVGASYGHAEAVAGVRALLRASEPRWREEPIATLGSRLGLFRRCVSARATIGVHFDVGASEIVDLTLCETDGAGETVQRLEVFSEDKLAAAAARLYERYAELLPDGPERLRAEATARSFAAMAWSPEDPAARLGPVLAPDVVGVDHRHLSGWSLHGASAYVEHLRALQQVADDIEFRWVDILALAPNAQLTRLLHTGTDRASGGVYERPFLSIVVADGDGKLARVEWFDVDREAEALARFDALVAKPATPARRVPANAATASVARFVAALEARDAGALPAFFDDALHVVHHPTGSTYGRREMLATWRSALRAERLEFRRQPIASLGDTLVLSRQVTAVAGLRESHLADFGATEVDEISLVETDAGGRWIHVELLAPDRLGDAVVSLYERHAAQQPEGPVRARAEATARAVAVVAPGGFDHDRYEAVFRPDAGVDDHRRLGFGMDIGPQTLFRSMAAARVVGDLLESGAQDVLAATHDALLLRWLTSGVGRESGGAFEWGFLRLFVFDRDGRVERYELFDDDRESEALARFDVLVGTDNAAPREHPFANAASRANRRRTEAFNARDWAGVEACVSPDLVFDERRRLLRNAADRDVWLAQTRLLFDLPESRFTVELLATRGERLSLHRHEFVGTVADGGGPLELDPHLALHEVDRDGRIALIVLFDLEDADAAYDQLDARFASDEASTNPRAVRALRSNHFVRARDWPAFAAAHVSGFVYRDHRLLGWGSTVGDLAALLRLMQSTVELVPDAQYRYDHVRIAAHGTLRQTTLLGTRDGGAFESPMLLVGEVDEQGLIARTDSYDVDDLDRALARFAELAAPARAESRFANAASRALDKLMAAWSARAWDAYARVLAGEHRQFDRRRLVQLALDREQSIAFARQIGEMAATRVEADLLATRGDRLALSRLHVEAAEGAVGPSEIVSLMLTETNDRGECSGQVRFDVDDQGAAYAELDARWEAGEAAQHPQASAWVAAFRRAFASRDWDAMSALQAQGQVANDYRLVGWGTLRGAGAWTPTLRELVALAPDVRQRVDHLRVAERGLLWHHAWQGTREGGEFESLLLLVVELDEDGRERRVDVWEADRFDAALARFAEIAAPAAARLGPFENTASHAWRATIDVWRQRDVSRFEALHPRALRYRDRRRLFQLDLDRQGFLDFTRPLLTMRTGSMSVELVATRGERLALMRFTMMLEDETVGPSAIDSLALIETDEHGTIAAYDRWDLEDLDAAYAELDARWPASEGAEDARAVASFQAFGAALDRHDWDAVAGFYASAFVGHDHRLASWGTLHGGAAFQETFRTLVELAPDVRMRRDHMRVSSRSMLLDAVWVGTRDGGAFESPFVAVQEFDAGGQVVRADFHDPHHLDRALARFEEIRASERRDPLAAIAKPNAASAALDRWQASYDVAFETGDWHPMRALCAPGFVLDDRRRLFPISGDPDFFIASARERAAIGARPLRTPLGAAGDRVAVQTLLWSGGPADGRFEIEYVFVGECDASGLLTAIVLFDPDDPRAAQREASARWAAIDPTVAPKLALMSSAADSFNERDRTRMRAIFADDLVVEDHRRAGMGRIEGGDAYTASIAVLWDLASVTTVEFGWYWPAIAPEGALITIRRTGDVAGGGPFESDYLYLFLHAHGRITRIELFELEDLDAALARFEEVHARERRERFATGVGPNLATAAMARNWAAFDVIDLDAAQEALDAARAQYAPDFVWDDRRPLVGLTGDLDLMVASARERLASGARHERRTILGTAGDRVAIGRVLWAGGPADGRFEVEFLVVTEVNEAGLFTAHVFFEPDDTRAAQREAWARWAAIEPAVAPWVELLSEITDAWNARDVARLLAILGDDFVIEDHRLAGLGRIEGAAAYMDANVVLWDLAPDQRVEFGSSFDAYDRHGLVATMRRIGTLPDGGAFESDYVWFSLARDGRITHLEFFEVEQRDEALARFEALRPDPLRAPETAATRMRDRNRDAFLARDWDAMRTLTGTDFVFEDRGKRALVRGDAESWIASMEFTSQPGFRTETALIGTLGDRIALDRVRWFGKPGGDAFEFERVRLLEVGADGLLRLVVFFDPEDRFAAAVEGLEHFAAGEAAGSAGIAPLVAFVRARFDRSWDAVRECLAPDLAFVDQRPLGFGTLDREQWIASLQAGDELGDGVIMEVYRVLAWSEHGHVAAIRRFGTIADGGGPFEVEAILTGLVVDGRIRRIEVFGEADAERAVARFEELCAARAAE